MRISEGRQRRRRRNVREDGSRERESEGEEFEEGDFGELEVYNIIDNFRSPQSPLKSF